MSPWVGDHPCLERHADRRAVETGSETTQDLRTHTCVASGVGTQSALPLGMSPVASTEPLCTTCNSPLYGEPTCSWCEHQAAYKRTIDALIAPKGAYKVLLASGGSRASTTQASSEASVNRSSMRLAQKMNAGQDWVVVARISYNGRAWEPGEYPTKEIPLGSEVKS